LGSPGKRESRHKRGLAVLIFVGHFAGDVPQDKKSQVEGKIKGWHSDHR
jgi:hypothetical protein